MTSAAVPQFERWLTELLDCRGLDGAVFADYASAIFSNSVPFGQSGDLSEAKESLLSYLESVTEESVDDLVTLAAGVWSGEIPLPERECEEASTAPGTGSGEGDASIEDVETATDSGNGGGGEDDRDDDLFASWERWESAEDDGTTSLDEPGEGDEALDAAGMLSCMFPGFDPDFVHAVLDETGYGFEDAVAYLLQCMASEGLGGAPDPAPALPEAPAGSRTVCRYYLEGGCYRADCWFAHDVGAMPCKFWQSGFCMKGAACEFLHGSTYPQQSAEAAPSLATKAHSDLYTMAGDEHFPQLNSGVGQAGAPATGGRVWSRKDMAASLKLDGLLAMYGELPAFVVRDAFEREGGDAERTDAALRAAHPGVKRRLPVAVAQSASKTPQVALSKSQVSRRPDGLENRAWVETGSAVARQYSELRAVAIDHSKLRNRYFQAATEAYLGNQHAAARELSRKGRYHHELSTRLHEEAASALFTARNKNKKGATKVIDLHGLHVAEGVEAVVAGNRSGAFHQANNFAIHALEQQLEQCREEWLYIITGTGHHSTRSRAKLLPAVQEYLDGAGYAYTDISTDQRGGMLKVRATPYT